jgi:hypothetical protein
MSLNEEPSKPITALLLPSLTINNHSTCSTSLPCLVLYLSLSLSLCLCLSSCRVDCLWFTGYTSDMASEDASNKVMLRKKGAKGLMTPYRLRTFVLEGSKFSYYQNDRLRGHIDLTAGMSYIVHCCLLLICATPNKCDSSSEQK